MRPPGIEFEAHGWTRGTLGMQVEPLIRTISWMRFIDFGIPEEYFDGFEVLAKFKAGMSKGCRNRSLGCRCVYASLAWKRQRVRGSGTLVKAAGDSSSCFVDNPENVKVVAPASSGSH